MNPHFFTAPFLCMRKARAFYFPHSYIPLFSDMASALFRLFFTKCCKAADVSAMISGIWMES